MGKTERLFKQAVNHLNEQDLDNALRLFNQVLNRVPSHREALKHKAIIKNRMGNVEEAKAFLQFAIEQCQDDDLQQMLGALYLKSNHHERALTHFRRSVELNGDNAAAHYGLGLAYAYHKDDQQNAITHFTNAINCKSGYADAYFNRGCSHMILQQMKEAEKDFQKARQLGHAKAAEMLSEFF